MYSVLFVERERGRENSYDTPATLVVFSLGHQGNQENCLFTITTRQSADFVELKLHTALTVLSIITLDIKCMLVSCFSLISTEYQF